MFNLKILKSKFMSVMVAGKLVKISQLIDTPKWYIVHRKHKQTLLYSKHALGKLVFFFFFPQEILFYLSQL